MKRFRCFARSLYLLPLAALLGQTLPAAALSFEIPAPKQDLKQVPVTLYLASDPTESGERAMVEIDGATVPAQITALGLESEKAGGAHKTELHFIAPELKAGEPTKAALVTTTGGEAEDAFEFKPVGEDFIDLAKDGKKILRYVRTPYDPDNREATYKVFHHVFDSDGNETITKGPGGRYTHHRGIFYGFSKTRYDGKTVDIWHCSGDTHQEHAAVLRQETGPVLARQRVLINWNGKDGETFAQEERELTLWNVPGGNLIDFTSLLKPQVDTVVLDGDPQHAGFHFRAANEVASSTSGQTYYLRPDGKDEPRRTRNWPGNKEHVNLPWNAMSFVADGQRYTTLYIDHERNPKEARFSERDYGRFGSYFVKEVPKDDPLLVQYRLFITPGELDVSAAEEHKEAFRDFAPVK